MTLLKEGFTNDLNQADYKNFSMRPAWKKNLSKNCLRHPQPLNLQSVRGMRLRPHMAYMQIFSKNEKKNMSMKTCQPISIVTRISLLIKTNHPDHSNPKYYAQRRWFLSKTSWEKPIIFIAKKSGPTMVRPASSDFWKGTLRKNSKTPQAPPLPTTTIIITIIIAIH